MDLSSLEHVLFIPFSGSSESSLFPHTSWIPVCSALWSKKTNSVRRLLPRILFILKFGTLFWSVGNVISVPVRLSRIGERDWDCLNFITFISASIDTLKMTKEGDPVDYRVWIRRLEFTLSSRGTGSARFCMACPRKAI